MKNFLLPVLTLCALAGCSLWTPASDPEEAAFAPVRVLLETNCVHCHGDYHLPEMPPITSTKALAALIGPANWIIPGQPEQSRFYLVASYPDTKWGAMPPTGHAITKSELRALRTWIQSGAKVPSKNTALKPRGELPRSR